MNGQVSGTMVAMTGRLRISGDMGLALQLASLFPVFVPSKTANGAAFLRFCWTTF